MRRRRLGKDELSSLVNRLQPLVPDSRPKFAFLRKRQGFVEESPAMEGERGEAVDEQREYFVRFDPLLPSTSTTARSSLRSNASQKGDRSIAAKRFTGDRLKAQIRERAEQRLRRMSGSSEGSEHESRIPVALHRRKGRSVMVTVEHRDERHKLSDHETPTAAPQEDTQRDSLLSGASYNTTIASTSSASPDQSGLRMESTRDIAADQLLSFSEQESGIFNGSSPSREALLLKRDTPIAQQDEHSPTPTLQMQQITGGHHYAVVETKATSIQEPFAPIGEDHTDHTTLSEVASLTKLAYQGAIVACSVLGSQSTNCCAIFVKLMTTPTTYKIQSERKRFFEEFVRKPVRLRL